MSRRVALATLVLACFCMAATAARAATVVVQVPGDVYDRPVLSPTGAWVVMKQGGAFHVVDVGFSALRPLVQFDPLLTKPLPSRSHRSFVLAGSQRRLALAMSSGHSVGHGFDHDSVDDGGTLQTAAPDATAAETLVSCPMSSAGDVAVDGDTVAWLPGCDPDTRTIAVHDYADGAEAQIRAPGGAVFLGVQVAGDHVATLMFSDPDSFEIVVFDWRSGRETRRASAGPDSIPFDYAVAPDGTLAVVQESFDPPNGGPCRQGPQRLEVYEPGVAAARVVRTRLCLSEAFDLKMRDGYLVGSEHRDENIRRYALLRLADGRTTVIGDWERRSEGIDFDGQRIARLSEGCDGTQLVLDDLASVTATGPPPTAHCRVAVRHAAITRVDAKGRITVEVACPDGCSAENSGVNVAVAGVPTRPPDFSTRFGAHRAQTATVLVKVSHAARRLVAAAGRPRATVTVTLYQPDATVTRVRMRTTLVAR